MACNLHSLFFVLKGGSFTLFFQSISQIDFLCHILKHKGSHPWKYNMNTTLQNISVQSIRIPVRLGNGPWFLSFKDIILRTEKFFFVGRSCLYYIILKNSKEHFRYPKVGLEVPRCRRSMRAESILPSFICINCSQLLASRYPYGLRNISHDTLKRNRAKMLIETPLISRH